ncbi:sigma-54-dependent Fis family transcriptional regulator [Thermodesulfobacterium sp. TA1]|uniref:sigma-54-dependent transcriptional regulator n=1 Tax=Thermodesulfobacterium sp. TA1 TaxID=2234087 RepID=UPI001231AC17|nr:sigma-54 dependent transcriptional regulator [Thermodesulfobacterium sp. TA1]QER41902.1 sigma-54-dependent Fis family transcriptional regulator [Thermodesulfobacterium sp. TA1]
MKGRILIVDDEPIILFGLSHYLKDQGFEVETCETGTEVLKKLEAQRFDLCIVDLKLPDIDGLTLLRKIKTQDQQVGVIMITAFAEIKSAVQAIKEGAFDYLAKPFTNEELMIAIEKFFEFKTLRKEVDELREKLKEKEAFKQIVGESKAIKDILNKIELVAKTDVSVLILGESGTGKELIADCIQALSLRADKPYLKINCAAIPENLFEAELFGYEKGAFTGAYNSKKGRLELANGGTLFFDEIAELPQNLQAKLLRVLEDQTLYRLGSEKPIKIDVRFLYATSKNLRQLVKEGKFREDLYYRINVMSIEIPPLRERKEDIPILVNHFLKKFSEKFKKPIPQITEEAFQALMNYDYPGNVRELKHVIERAVLLAVDGKITLKHLPEEIIHSFKTETSDYKLAKEALEKEIILQALIETNWNKTEAAQKLGISRKTLWQKLKKFGLLPVHTEEE